jgi:hypothetical protein
MLPTNNFQDCKFNGKGAYSLQLDQVSLVDGYEDTLSHRTDVYSFTCDVFFEY